MRYFCIAYYQQPNGKYNESTQVLSRLKNRDYQNYSVILDFTNQQVIKCCINNTVIKDWSTVIDYYEKFYRDIFRQLINQNHFSTTDQSKPMKPLNQRLILTDVDGAILDWEYAFDVWMREHGFNKVEGGNLKYDIGTRYGIDRDQAKKLIRIFNESAAIGFLPPLRDAMYYVKRLREEHGFVFHAITSLSNNKNAQTLRRMNLKKLFGENTFEKFVFLDTGADKDQVLEQYRDSGCWWIEDKWLNCQAGLSVGLKPILVEHGHSLDFNHPNIHKVKNWKEIYDLILVGIES